MAERRTIKLTLPITTVSDLFLKSLPRARINTEEIPVIEDEAQLIPFMHSHGIICPICPENLQGQFILLGQVHTATKESRAYLFLCTRCKNVSYLPVTKQGVFKVDYLDARKRTLVEINNPLLAQLSEMRFDFDEFLQGTVGEEYISVLKKLAEVEQIKEFVSKVKKVPQPPAEIKKK